MPPLVTLNSRGLLAGWRQRAALLAALLIGFAMLITPSAGPVDPSPLPSRSPIISDFWPAAKVAVLPGFLAGGAMYEPLLFVDGKTSIGLATLTRGGAPNSALVSLVDGATRVLRDYGENPARVSAIADGDSVYWLELEALPDGASRTSVWSAGLAGGEPAVLAVDEARGVMAESGYDLVSADGRLYWVAQTEADRVNELHSVGLGGGAVTRRELPSGFTLREWPWAAKPAAGRMGKLELLNLSTGETVHVAAADNQIVDCGFDWCRVSTLRDNGRDVEHGLMKPDGTGYQSLSRNDGRYPVGVPPLLLDRFEFQAQAAPNEWQPDRLWLLDLANDREVLVSPSYSLRFGTYNGYVWWSSGDSEALQWNLLDLRQLVG
jgi:hypothetical protein